MAETHRKMGEFIASSVTKEAYKTYVPYPLPPVPPIDLEVLYPLLDKANTAIGRLDGMSLVLPDSALFLYMYIRKEAVLSSQIEGTQSSLSDLLLFEHHETPNVPIDDVAEVSNYVSAMNYGLKRLEELPLSLRLIREIHAKLMESGRGSTKAPGEFRRTQNWIGGSRPGNAIYVPPAPEKVMECMGELETFLHDETIKLPALIKAALAHVQFETIHPFLDGNGRLGRLLITFILCMEGVLREPLLYLSLYLKKNRSAYYAYLQSVRETGNWEAWLEFFLNGVIETAQQAVETAQSIVRLFETDRETINTSGKATASIVAIHHYFQRNPMANTGGIKEGCNLSLPTVLRSLTILEELKIIKEITGKERHKIYAYPAYLDILKQGTEPL